MPAHPLRLFVAIYPPPETARRWLALLQGSGGASVPLAIGEDSNAMSLPLPPLPAHRPTPAEQVHLTLQFIGDTDERDVDDVRESVRRACAGLPALVVTPRRLMTLPERGPARLVAIETDAPHPLPELHARLAKRLARNAKQREADRFLPHFTLARFAVPAPGLWMDIPLPSAEPNAALAGPALEFRDVLLMRSHLHPSGVQHREVGRFPLGAPA